MFGMVIAPRCPPHQRFVSKEWICILRFKKQVQGNSSAQRPFLLGHRLCIVDSDPSLHVTGPNLPTEEQQKTIRPTDRTRTMQTATGVVWKFILKRWSTRRSWTRTCRPSWWNTFQQFHLWNDCVTNLAAPTHGIQESTRIDASMEW